VILNKNIVEDGLENSEVMYTIIADEIVYRKKP